MTEKYISWLRSEEQTTGGKDKIIKMNQNILTILILKQLGEYKISNIYKFYQEITELRIVDL